MNKFLNKTCPVCRQKIKDSDEVVVCPECGTPHHRACYFAENKCAMEALHGKFEWHGSLPDETAHAASSAQSEQDEANGNDATNLNSSTMSEEEVKDRLINLLNGSEKSGAVPPPEFDSDVDRQVYEEIKEMMFPALQLMGAEANPVFFEAMTRRMVNPKKGKDDISMRELVYFSSTSFFHYQKCFSYCMLGKYKPNLNLGAALFYPINQFYRKMSGFATLLTLFILLTEGLPLLVHKLGYIGDSLLNTLMIAGGVVSVAMTIFLALYNDFFYYKHCVRQIKKIRKRFDNKTDNIEYYHELAQCGRPSLLLALFGLLVTVFVRVFIAVVLTKQ